MLRLSCMALAVSAIALSATGPPSDPSHQERAAPKAPPVMIVETAVDVRVEVAVFELVIEPIVSVPTSLMSIAIERTAVEASLAGFSPEKSSFASNRDYRYAGIPVKGGAPVFGETNAV